MPTENIEILLENNRKWAARLKKQNPTFFEELAQQQAPQFLWIGCSDSRLPATDLVGLLPGEIFVHRNIANLVYTNDPNCMAVLQYAVEALQVKHIIVCGHYGCGGVQAALDGSARGGFNSWVRSISEAYEEHRQEIEHIADQEQRLNRLCEINVHAQVKNICRSDIVQNAWRNKQQLTVHGWIYSLLKGHIAKLEEVGPEGLSGS
jgi:carbonic anhydrase